MPLHVRDIQVGKMKDRVCISSMKDRVEDGSMMMTREGIITCWAMVDLWRASYQAPTGYVVDAADEKPTHYIYTRFRYDTIFTTATWIYNERLKSPPRWFKVIAVSDVDEEGRFTCFTCRLVEQSDSVSAPQPPRAPQFGALPLPDSVKL